MRTKSWTLKRGDLWLYTVQQIISALKLYDKIKKVVPTVKQLGYPATHTLYKWINQRKATNGKFPNLMPSGVKSINLKVKMDHDGCFAERKLQILKGTLKEQKTFVMLQLKKAFLAI